MSLTPPPFLPTPAGSVNLELVDSDSCATNPFAKCFSSMVVEVTSGCDVTVTPVGAGNYVDAMWTGGTAPYAMVQACPAAGDSALTVTATDDSDLLNSLGTLLAGAIWDIPLATPPTVTTAAGVVTVTDGACALKYRVSDYTDAGFATVVGPACTSGPECGSHATDCAAGTYAVPVASATGYICALCPPGECRLQLPIS